jgi:hypothetical protein
MPGPIYSINGRQIHEGHTGWRVLRAGTNTQGGIVNTLNNVKAPSRNGYTPGPTTFSEQIVVLVVRTPRGRLDELLTLCAAATSLTNSLSATKELRVELASAIPSGESVFDETFDVSITLSAYEGVWRDISLSTIGPVTIASPVQTLTMFDDISAPVSDMDIFLKGVFGEFVLLDSNGSWLKTVRPWPGSAGTGLLYSGKTQQAFLANESDPFVPVSDKSQYIDVSGNGGFELTPQMVSGNPADRTVSLQLTTLTQTSTTLRVRAKAAYRMN